MAVTKITVSTAMRARDVSRPSAEHFAEAGRGEAATRQPEVPAAGPPRAPAAPAPALRAGPADPAPPPARRRRRRGR
jgi:hypothetical protein